jgi:phenylacetate-CoA ligase
MRGFLKSLLAGANMPMLDIIKIAYDLIPPSWRYGKPYKECLALLEQSEQWDANEWVVHQESRLRMLMRHCYRNVPYYRELFEKSGLVPEDIQNVADLAKLPFLTKDIVRKRKNDLIARDFSLLERDPESTSGATGTPLDFYSDRPARAMERALALRQLLWLGYRTGDRIAEIKDDMFCDPERVFRYFPGSRELRFSFFQADPARLDTIVSALAEFKPAFIRAYPSSLFLLSRWMERKSRRIPRPKYILTSSENLYPSTRVEAEEIFGCPVVDHYGQIEKVATAFQCDRGAGYHIQVEQAIVELVPNQGAQSEIVGTSLYAFGMPFIRYRTGDLAEMSYESCSCGRKHYSLSRIAGRESEIIITPDRLIITPVAIDNAFYNLAEIREAQIVQHSIDFLQVNIVPWDEISEQTKQTLMNRVMSYLNPTRMNVTINVVERIHRTKGGKKLFIVSHLDKNHYLRSY